MKDYPQYKLYHKTHKKPAFIDIFAEVKRRLDIVEVARHYGTEIRRNNTALCPFHDDKTPSMSFKNGRFKCFACGAGGTVIDLISNLFNLSPLEATKKVTDHPFKGWFEFCPIRALLVLKLPKGIK